MFTRAEMGEKRIQSIKKNFGDQCVNENSFIKVCKFEYYRNPIQPYYATIHESSYTTVNLHYVLSSNTQWILRLKYVFLRLISNTIRSYQIGIGEGTSHNDGKCWFLSAWG